MRFAGIVGEPPQGNKVDKTRAWLRLANNQNADPLSVLGKVITEFMEVNSAGYAFEADLTTERDKLIKVLREHGLEYLKGGQIMRSSAGVAGRKLEEIITARNLTGLQTEFERIEKRGCKKNCVNGYGKRRMRDHGYQHEADRRTTEQL